MSLPPRFLDELRTRLPLSEIVGKRVRVTRAGREFKACCPFHREKSPSFYINDEKQFFHCFGCGAHGDIVGFVMRHDNLSFIEAVEALAAQAGMTVPRSSPDAAAQAQKEKGLHSLLEEVARWYEARLDDPAQAGVRSYLAERGLDVETCAAFRIGFAPADGDGLRKSLLEKGFSLPQMIEAGVFRASTRGGAPYAFFRDRVMFPVADRRGRIVAFGGRVLPEALRTLTSAEKPPKYINSSDSPLFHKGRMLYGESHARQAAADGLPIVVVEGYMDVIACFRAGVRGAVAPLGTALTEEQIVQLWRVIPSTPKLPVLCFDGDDAGRRAAQRAAERVLPLLKADCSVTVAFLPQGEDPDSLIRGKGAKAFEAVLAGAQPLVDFLWDQLIKGRRLDLPEERAGLEQAAEALTTAIADRAVQTHYRAAFRERMSALFYAARRRASPPDRFERKGGGTSSASAPPPVKVSRPARAGQGLAPAILLATLLAHPEIFDSVEEPLGHMNFSDPGLEALRQACLHALITDSSLDRMSLQRHLIAIGHASVLEHVVSDQVLLHAAFARPERSADEALEGWKATWRALSDRAHGRELRDAAREWARSDSDADGARLVALGRSGNGAGGGG